MKKQDKKIEIVLAFAMVQPFSNIAENQTATESESEDVTGEEPLDDPLAREPLDIDQVKDTEPVKEEDLEDLEPVDPYLEEMAEEDDFEDLEEDED